MAYFDDLTSCTYHSGPHDAANWTCALLAVGWLESPYEYSEGVVSGEVLDKIIGLTHAASGNFSSFRGLHHCSLCHHEGLDENSLPGSHYNLFLPGEGEVFLAPGRIDHYIVRHGYKPPERFMEAVMQCPLPGSRSYFDKLDEVNGGVEAPLVNLGGKRPIH